MRGVQRINENTRDREEVILVMRPWYLYLEIFPNGKTYVGITIDPAHRHRQHIGELKGQGLGAQDIRWEIERSGALPTMRVLAICSAGKGDYWENRGEAESYEWGITLSLVNSGWDILNREFAPDKQNYKRQLKYAKDKLKLASKRKRLLQNGWKHSDSGKK